MTPQTRDFSTYLFGDLQVSVMINKDGEVQGVYEVYGGEELHLDDVKIKNAKGDYIDILSTLEGRIQDELNNWEEDKRLDDER